MQIIFTLTDCNCNFIDLKNLQIEQSWQNIPTLSWLYLVLHNSKTEFQNQNLGQDFSWDYKHTSGIHSRHTHVHIIPSHIRTLLN